MQGMVNLINAVPVVTQERTVFYRCVSGQPLHGSFRKCADF